MKILKSIEPIIILTDKEKEAFVNILRSHTYKKKEYLQQEGEVCKSIYFINAGCFRVFTNVDGAVLTLQFITDGDWYTDYGSLLTATPAEENFQAITPGEVVQFTGADINKLYDEFPRMEKIGRTFAEIALISIHNKNKMLTNRTSDERYHDLMAERPGLLLEIPHHYIASYLNITPETLSRVRKLVGLNDLINT